MIAGDRKETIVGLIITVLLGVVFTGLQVMEYYEASFTIADSVYGSVFFLATGFHGMHVCIGEIFLIVSLIRIIDHQMTKHHHNGYEAAI
jgi:cytochrome c oxidase subunit 3